MTNRDKFTWDFGRVVKYAFREKCKVKDMKNLQLFWDAGMHRQMRFGIYFWNLANLDVYDLQKHWDKGVCPDRYCMNGKPVCAQSIDVDFKLLFELDILKDFSFENCKDLAREIGYYARNTTESFMSDEECEEIMKKYEGDEDEDT